MVRNGKPKQSGTQSQAVTPERQNGLHLRHKTYQKEFVKCTVLKYDFSVNTECLATELSDLPTRTELETGFYDLTEKHGVPEPYQRRHVAD